MRIDLDGTRLWFDVEGAGLVPDGASMRERPTLLLLHGGPGSYDHSYLKPGFAPLAERLQLVYLDLRGHGRSDWGDAAAWSFEACADDVRAFCDALGIERPFVLGHSMGGPVALLYAARHPGHAAGIVVLEGFVRFDVDRLVANVRRVAGDEAADVIGRRFTGGQVTPEEWPKAFAAYGPNLPGDEELARRLQNPEVAARGLELMNSLDLAGALGAVASPTLVLVGDRDFVTPVEAAEEVVAALPDGIARLEVLHGAGHFPWKDVPDALLERIGRFAERPG